MTSNTLFGWCYLKCLCHLYIYSLWLSEEAGFSSLGLVELGVHKDIPIHRTVNELLHNRHVIVFSTDCWELRNGTNRLAEEAIGDRQNVGFVDDGQVLSGIFIHSVQSYKVSHSYLALSAKCDFKCHLTDSARSIFGDEPSSPCFLPLLANRLFLVFNILQGPGLVHAQSWERAHTRHSVFSRTTTRSIAAFCPGSGATYSTTILLLEDAFEYTTIARTDTTGRMFAYRSSSFRMATMGDE